MCLQEGENSKKAFLHDITALVEKAFF